MKHYEREEDKTQKKFDHGINRAAVNKRREKESARRKANKKNRRR